MKKNKTLIKELRVKLRYHQMGTRMAMYSLRNSIAKCKEIAAEMRRLQQAK